MHDTRWRVVGASELEVASGLPNTIRSSPDRPEWAVWRNKPTPVPPKVLTMAYPNINPNTVKCAYPLKYPYCCNAAFTP